MDNTQFEKNTINGKQYFTCVVPECGKKFKYKSEIHRHIAIHSNSRPFSCSFPNCSKTFKRVDALQSHMSIHSSKPTLTCPVHGCQSLFTTRSALQYHLLKHNGEKSFQCEAPGCEKTFLTLAHLKQHEMAINYHNKVKETSSPSSTIADVAHLKHKNSEDFEQTGSSPLNFRDLLKSEDLKINLQRESSIQTAVTENAESPKEEFDEFLVNMFISLKQEKAQLERHLLNMNMNILQNYFISQHIQSSPWGINMLARAQFQPRFN